MALGVLTGRPQVGATLMGVQMSTRTKASLKAFAASSLVLFAITLGGTFAPSPASAFTPPPIPSSNSMAFEIPANDGGQFNAVSCTDATDCTAVGYDNNGPIYATETAGVWGPATEPGSDNGGGFYGVSCVDALDCTAVGGDSDGYAIYASEINGTWGDATEIPGDTAGAQLNSVNCFDAQDCLAVGGDSGRSTRPIAVFEDTGDWAYDPEQINIPGNGQWNSISCELFEPFCIGVGNFASNSQSFFGFGAGAGWEWDYLAEDSTATSLSCTTDGCTAVGQNLDTYNPYVITTGPDFWNTPTDIPSEEGGGFNSVSCIDQSDCMAVGWDYADQAIFSTEVGGSWSPASEISDPNGSEETYFSGVSCAGGGSCTAVGGDDNNEPIVDVLSLQTAPTLPEPPASTLAVAGNSSATVTWTASASTGGATITNYTATASPGGASCTVTETAPQPVGGSCTVTGLTNGQSYTFTVTATSSAGTSGTGPPTVPVTPAGPPSAPTGVQVTAVASATPNAQGAQVSWTTPASNGGDAITSYTATASPGGASCTCQVQTPSTNACEITGLQPRGQLRGHGGGDLGCWDQRPLLATGAAQLPRVDLDHGHGVAEPGHLPPFRDVHRHGDRRVGAGDRDGHVHLGRERERDGELEFVRPGHVQDQEAAEGHLPGHRDVQGGDGALGASVNTVTVTIH